jgi:hypothetical protein
LKSCPVFFAPNPYRQLSQPKGIVDRPRSANA